MTWYNPKLGLPEITIGSFGLGFNHAAVKILRKPIQIKIGIMDDGKTMIVYPLKKEDNEGISFIQKEKQGYVRINNKSLIKFISSRSGNDFSRTTKYEGRWIKDKDWLEINLDKPIWTAKKNEKKKSV